MERRAKYSADELEALGKKGHAFKNADSSYSYPIDDIDDLKKAVRAVGRGNADHDAIRKYVAERAKALGESDLIPDNWNADGSLKETKGVWRDLEQRDTAMDVFAALDSAVADLCGQYDSWSVWVQDWYGASDGDNPYTVAYHAGGELWQAPFGYDENDKVVIGEAVKVRPVTAFVERSQKPRHEKRRLAARTTEWRRERAPRRGDREMRQQASPIELREVDGGNGLLLNSYASLFDTPYTVGSGEFRYEETVCRGAFTRTLNSTPDVVFRPDHEGPVLGRTSSGSLRLVQDERGLNYEVDLNPADPDVQRLVPKIERKDLTESSFAFRCIDDKWSEDYSRRSLKACDLHRGDVSIVTFGASPATGRFMSLRSEEALQALRAHGFDEFMTAWLEWRDFTLAPPEQRAGKTLSASSMDVLSNVLKLVASADDAVDQAQPLLADLMGVPNPDSDDSERGEAEETETGTNVIDLPAWRGDEFLLELRGLEGRR